MSKLKNKLIAKIWLKTNAFLIGLILFFDMSSAFAQIKPGGGGQSIGTIAGTVTTSFSGLARLLTATSYIAGIGFALTAILKFKQHKDNPQQIPIGTPIALLFIAAGLIFLPTIFGVANQTIFGGSGQMGGISGTTG